MHRGKKAFRLALALAVGLVSGVAAFPCHSNGTFNCRLAGLQNTLDVRGTALNLTDWYEFIGRTSYGTIYGTISNVSLLDQPAIQ